ncbi:MAG TPA: hypothetical protein ENJ19_00995, partial [Gammaproteobacteria bacterium]|nr:hypothetical protein [Gammaproteobacteria bacterium]
MKMKKALMVLMCAIAATGCAVGNKYNYSAGDLNLPVKTTATKGLVLKVEDRRPYVVNGDKKPQFVGIQRGGLGVPFDVTTVSGEPLVSDMATSIKKGLEQSGYHVTVVPDASDLSSLLLAVRDGGAFRLLWLKVDEWKSDIYMDIGLSYDLLLEVYDATGKKLAESRIHSKDSESVGGAKLFASQTSEYLVQEFAKLIGYLFNKKSV